MQNTYQDLITAVQNKNPAISPKPQNPKTPESKLSSVKQIKIVI